MKIDDLAKLLRVQDKDALANVIETDGFLSVESYSKKLWQYSTEINFEPELIEAFKIEFKRVGIEESIWDEVIASMQKYRTIQTAPHTGLMDSTSVPALTLHHIALEAKPEDGYYIVGTFSGIPFGNDSYPGTLSFSKQHDFTEILKENSPFISIFKKRQEDRERDNLNEKWNRINLYDNGSRDALVYRSQIPDAFVNTYKELKPVIKDYLAYTEGQTDFTKVMVNTTQNFARKFFNNEKIIYIDINEVISNYLVLILKNSNHFAYKMFFDEIMHKHIMDIWSSSAHFFYDMVDGKNGPKQVNTYIDSFVLKNGIKEENITPEILIDKLKNTRLCPGVFVGFTVLAFLNGFQCFGSFKQVCYLTDYKKTWIESNLLPTNIQTVKTYSLTTGALPLEADRYKTAIDIILGESIDFKKGVKSLDDIILPLEERLLGFKV